MRGLLARVKTTGRRILPRHLPAITGPGHRINIGPGGVHRRIHIRHLGLHQLKRANRLAKLFAFPDIGHHHIKTGSHDANTNASQNHPLIIQPRHQHRDAAAFLAQHIVKRHRAIVKDQLAGVGGPHAQLVELLRRGKPGHRPLDQKCGDPARACIRIGLGIHHQRLRIRSIGDPHLGAVQDIAVIALLGPQRHRNHIRSRAGLRHGQRPHIRARNQAGQKPRLLRGRGPAPDLIDTEIGMGTIAQRHRG